MPVGVLDCKTSAAISNAASGADFSVSASPTYAVTRTRRSSQIMLLLSGLAMRLLVNSELSGSVAAVHNAHR